MNATIPTRLLRGCLAVSLLFALTLSGCKSCPACVVEEGPVQPWVDPALNGAWVIGSDYITELRFDKGQFEWTWDGHLQQRGVYDTKDGILTVTIQHQYASPVRILGATSRPYSIAGTILTWGGNQFTKK
jgi:hypothetical protein